MYTSEQYHKTLPLLGSLETPVKEYIEGLEGEEKLLMQFLYGTMPLADAADYAPELFHSYVKHGLYLYRNDSRTGELPEDIFLNYVLYYRVNNEDITDCRPWFYEMLQPLAHNRDTSEAVKEINYWCASQASYAAADERTLSPIGVFNSGTGRCGEESTFLVSALRSVGIAARQVYTPRWAHCDDNHAWVEVWIGGKWYFLGACEPEEVLNKGWFTNASSRTMMIHSRVFSDYQCEGTKEETTERLGAAIFLNNTANYAKVTPVTVSVEDEQGTALEGIRVEFQLLNSACYSSIAALYTDHKGQVRITLGQGTILVQAGRAGLLSQVLADTSRETDIRLILSETEWNRQLQEQKEGWVYGEHRAPAESRMHPVTLTGEQKETGSRRREQSEAARQKKLAGYREELSRYLEKEDADILRQAEDILELAYGNAKQIRAFLEAFPQPEAVRFLRVLATKDYRDITAELLGGHYEAAGKLKEAVVAGCAKHNPDPEEIFYRYVANPRLEFEPITPFRSILKGALTEEEKEAFSKAPRKIEEWIRERFSREEDRNYSQIVFTPEGMLKTGKADSRSERLLFVAICRTLGVPARIDPVTRDAQYLGEDGFVTVFRDEEKNYSRSRCELTVCSEDSPAYGSRWTINRLCPAQEKGEIGFQTMEYWGETFRDGKMVLDLEEGIYQLITASRLPSGNQLENKRILDTRDFAEDAEGKKKGSIELVFVKPQLSQMLEDFPLEDFVLRDAEGQEQDFSGLLEGKNTLLAFLETGVEPTEHLLNELVDNQEAVAQSGLNILFVVQDEESLVQPAVTRARAAVVSRVFYDSFRELPEQLARRMYTDPEKLPLVILVDTTMTGRYACSGYNVGSVEMVLQISGLLSGQDKVKGHLYL